MAKVLHLSPQPSPETIHEANSCIQQGGVLSVGTESSYALAAGAWNADAIERVVTMKGDRQKKPILLLIGERSQLDSLIATLPLGAQVLMEHFWPGPLTMVFPAAFNLPESLTCGTGTVGIRQPSESRLLALLKATGPLTGTSANRSGERPSQTSEEVMRSLGDRVDLILDGGASPGGLPSTVLSLVGKIRLLRKGPISSEAIKSVLSAVGTTLQDSAE